MSNTNSTTTETADGTLHSVLYQLTLAFAIVGAFIIGYEILRQSRIGKYIYAPRLLLLPDQTPEVANGWFAWFTKNKKIDEDYILRNNGVDAVMVLKLYRMGYRMFFVIALFVLIFTLPINIAFNEKDDVKKEKAEAEASSFSDLFESTIPNENDTLSRGVDENTINGTEPLINEDGNMTQTLLVDANGNSIDPSQPVTDESGVKALYHLLFDKRALQVDIINLEDEKGEDKKGKHQVDNTADANANGNGNADVNANASGNADVNANADANANANADGNNENANTDANANANADGNNENANGNENNVEENKEGDKSNILNEIENTTKNIDIKKYILFSTMKEGKKLFSLFHLVAVYFVVGFICYMLYKIYQEYLNTLERYVKDDGIVQERNIFGEILQHSTIMVRNIPPELQDDERLMTWFTKLGIGKIESVVIARSRNRIRKLVEQRTKVLNELEDDYVKWQENIKEKKEDKDFIGEKLKSMITNTTDDIGEKVFEDEDLYRPKSVIYKYGFIPVRYVDSIQYNEQQLLELTHQIKELRLEAAQSKKWSQTAFITFSNHQSAKIAAQLILYSSKNPNVMSASTAPHPNDLLYKNLNMRTEHKTYRSIIIYIAMFFVCFLLAILVIATKYETLRSICERWFAFAGPNKFFDIIDRTPSLQALFQSFFQVILLNIYTSGVPYMLKFLSNYQGFETKSAYANSVLKKYYVFLVIIIIFSMAISTVASKIIDPSNIKQVTNVTGEVANVFLNINFTDFVKRLTAELKNNTITYFNYGILRLQSFGFEIFRIGAVVLYFVSKLLKKDSPRAQHLAKQMASPPDYSIMLAVPLLCFTLFITFCIVNPFIPIIGVIFFFIGYHVMKNQFIYVYVKDFDSQGLFFITSFNRIIFSLFVFEIFMFGYFLLIFGSNHIIPYLILPALIITYYFSRYCRKCFKPRVKNVPVDLLISKERKEKYSNQYQRRTIFGKTDSFVSDYFEDDSFISCATHITSLDNKPNKEILKIAEVQAPDLPSYYEAKSYNNPALTEILYAPWISEEAQSVFTEATINHIVSICKDCYKCDKESRFD